MPAEDQLLRPFALTSPSWLRPTFTIPRHTPAATPGANHQSLAVRSRCENKCCKQRAMAASLPLSLSSSSLAPPQPSLPHCHCFCCASSSPASAVLTRLPFALLLPNILRWMPVFGAAYFSSFPFALHVQWILSYHGLRPRPFPPHPLLCLLLRDTACQPDACGLHGFPNTTVYVLHDKLACVLTHHFCFPPLSSCMPQTITR